MAHTPTISVKDVVVYNGVYFHVTRLTPSVQTHTIKQTIGKELKERAVFGTITQDRVLLINGLLVGSLVSSGIENRWDKLDSSQDGIRHVYSDGKYPGSYVIRNAGLQLDADPLNENALLFTIELVEW